jgi:Fe2+ transport system protein B
MSRSVIFTPPMSKSEFRSLPQELRMVIMRGIAALNKSIELLLQSKGETSFDVNFNNVILEYIQYYESLIQGMNEKDLQLLFEKTYTSNSNDTSGAEQTQIQTQTKSSLEQTLDYIVEVIADITKLVVKDQRHMSNIIEQYMHLGAYSAILNYIINSGETNIEPSILKKILRNSQERRL